MGITHISGAHSPLASTLSYSHFEPWGCWEMKPLVACGGCGLKLHRYGRRVHRFEETTTVYYNKEPEDYPNWDRGNCGSFNGHQKCHEKEEKKKNCKELYAHLKENEQ